MYLRENTKKETIEKELPCQDVMPCTRNMRQSLRPIGMQYASEYVTKFFTCFQFVAFSYDCPFGCVNNPHHELQVHM